MKQHESVWVYDAFVEDESASFGACDDSEVFGGLVSPDEIGVDHSNLASFVQRLCDFDVIVKFVGSTDV